MKPTTVIACCAPPVIIAIDFAVLVVAVPQMRLDLALTKADVRWMFSGYSLSFGALLLTAGRCADTLGRRRLLITGMGTFATAAAVASMARNGEVAVAARTAQGVGAAIMSPAALSLLTSLPRDGTERRRATALYGVAISAGFVTGALASGVLATLAGWRLALALTIPLCLGGAVAASQLPSNAGHDTAGVVGWTASLLVACLIATGAVAATRREWLGLLVPAMTTATLLLFAERVGRSVTGNGRMIASACATGLVVTGTGVAATLLWTLFLQEGRGYTPLQTGWVFACFGAAAWPGALTARSIAAKRPPGTLLGAGLAAQGAGLLLAVAAIRTGLDFGLVASVAGFGFGHVIGNASVAAVVTAGAPPVAHGTLAGTLASTQYLGGALGPALIDRLGVEATSNAIEGGMAACGTVALVTAAVIWLVLRRVRWPRCDMTIEHMSAQAAVIRKGASGFGERISGPEGKREGDQR